MIEIIELQGRNDNLMKEKFFYFTYFISYFIDSIYSKKIDSRNNVSILRKDSRILSNISVRSFSFFPTFWSSLKVAELDQQVEKTSERELQELQNVVFFFSISISLVKIHNKNSFLLIFHMDVIQKSGEERIQVKKKISEILHFDFFNSKHRKVEDAIVS